MPTTVTQLRKIMEEAEARGHGNLPAVVLLPKEGSLFPYHGLYTDSEGDTVYVVDSMREVLQKEFPDHKFPELK